MSEQIRQLHELYNISERSGPKQQILTLTDPRNKGVMVAMCFGRDLTKAYEVACRLIPAETKADGYDEIVKQLDEERGKRLRLETEATDLRIQIEELKKKTNSGGKSNPIRTLREGKGSKSKAS